MNVRQEEWSPTKGWSTIQDSGDFHQANIVFCQSNNVAAMPSSWYREVKYAFPNTPILFTCTNEFAAPHGFLTAFQFRQTPVSVFSYNEELKRMDTIIQPASWGKRIPKINNILVCTAKGLVSEEAITEQLLDGDRMIKEPSQIMPTQFGLNQLQSSPMAFAIAFHGNKLTIESDISIQKEKKDADTVAAQAINRSASLRFIESGDNKSASVPITYTFLLKR